MKIQLIAVSLLAVAAGLSSARAADLVMPRAPVMVAPAPADPGIVGYLDVHAGGLSANQTFGRNSDTESGVALGGAARGAIDLSDLLSDQFDVWFDGDSLTDSSRPGSSAFVDVHGGIADHLTFRVTDADVVGLMGSVGTTISGNSGEAAGFMGTAAFEAAHSEATWRAFAQVGYSNVLTGGTSSNAQTKQSGPYAAVVGEYFLDPNLMLEARLGAAGLTATSTPDSTTVNAFYWGAKVEYKPDWSPASFYAEYKGAHEDESSGPSTASAYINKFLVGLRVPLGTESVQSLQNRVGLEDMNPLYGDQAF